MLQVTIQLHKQLEEGKSRRENHADVVQCLWIKSPPMYLMTPGWLRWIKRNAFCGSYLTGLASV